MLQFWGLAPEPLDLCRVQGRDVLAALQKVVSADLRGQEEGTVRPSLLLHPKGQFRALFAVARLGGEVWLVCPPGRGEEVARGLHAYLRFSRVQVEPVAPQRFLLVGPGSLEWLRARGATWAQPGRCGSEGQVGIFAETLLGLPGALVVGEAPPSLPVWEPEELERARVMAGFPAWAKELTPDVLPQEVGLREPWVSLTKGCYVGQETMARLATYGHVNRLLVRLRGAAGDPDPAGLEPLPRVLVDPESSKTVGRLTSLAKTPEGGLLGLGLVHRSVAREGRVLGAESLQWVIHRVLA